MNEFIKKKNTKNLQNSFITWRIRRHKSVIQREQNQIADQM